MPQPVSGAAGHDRGPARMYAETDLDWLAARAALPPARRLKMQAAADAVGFRVTSYVADELIDWSAAPDDPIYRLVFPDPDMLDETEAGQSAGLPPRAVPPEQAVTTADQPGSRPWAGEQVLPGAYRTYHDTVSVYAQPGPAGSFGITCPGRDRPARHGPVMAAAAIPRLGAYLTAHPQVSVVEFAGADPLTMDTAALRRYVEPLLEVEHLVSVRLRTDALARWPYRFLTDADAGDLLRLLEQVAAGGKTPALIAGLSHPRELEADPARRAVRQIHGTGTVIYSQGTLAGTVNNTPAAWAAMWRAQVRLGIIPRTMILRPVTGPGRHFAVTLATAQQIFAHAFARVSGLARTVRGPAMRDEHGLLCIDGTTEAAGQKIFALRYLQARDPHMAGVPYFATYSTDATWLTDLHPVRGAHFPPVPATGREQYQ